MRVHGIDFTSAPRRGKPITVASGRLDAGGRVLHLESIDALPDFGAFEAWLRHPGPWLAVFDLPFGLPRELLRTFGWLPGAGERAAVARGDSDWAATIRQVSALSRPAFVERLRAFCATRPVGQKFAHRRADGPAGSSPSMKWVNPPVALMLHAGAPRLLEAGLRLPGLHPGDANRIGLEGYPGHLARAIIGRQSYKSDAAAGRTAQRRAAREAIVEALRTGAHPLALGVELPPALAAQCIDEASADRLDALLCLVQAGWAWQRRDCGFGLPEVIDPVEGWIVSVTELAG
jgi:hypothetical protein